MRRQDAEVSFGQIEGRLMGFRDYETSDPTNPSSSIRHSVVKVRTAYPFPSQGCPQTPSSSPQPTSAEQ